VVDFCVVLTRVTNSRDLFGLYSLTGSTSAYCIVCFMFLWVYAWNKMDAFIHSVIHNICLEAYSKDEEIVLALLMWLPLTNLNHSSLNHWHAGASNRLPCCLSNESNVCFVCIVVMVTTGRGTQEVYRVKTLFVSSRRPIYGLRTRWSSRRRDRLSRYSMHADF